MRVVDVRPDHEEEDVRSGAATLATEIEHPAKAVMVIRGTKPDVALFVDRVGARSDAFPWRAAVWLKVSEPLAKAIVGESRYAHWFPDAATCAVMLDFADNVKTRLSSDATHFAIDDAYLNARG